MNAVEQQCNRCGRFTWSKIEFDTEDRMTQPDGSPCGGRFGEVDNMKKGK